MDKKWIRNLQVAEKRKPTDHTTVTVEEKNETLLINVFLAGETRAAYRVVMTDDDYITRDIKNSTWKTGRIDAILGVSYWSSKNRPVISSGKKIYEKRFGKITDKRWWYSAYEWQTKIMDARREERYIKELKHTEDMQKTVPDPPKAFEKWIYDKALEDFHYMIYEPTKRVKAIGYCTHCGKYTEIDRKKIVPKRDQKWKCPNCKSPVTFKPPSASLNGRFVYYRGYSEPEKWVCLFQKTKEGKLLGRYIQAWARFERGAGIERKVSYCYTELARCFYGEKPEWFEYSEYKQSGKNAWCPNKDEYNCADAIVYTKNLKQALKGTKYQYCSLDLYQKAFPGKQIHVVRFMNSDAKKSEFLVKMKMFRLLNDLTDGWYKSHRSEVDLDAKTVDGFLKVPKTELKKVIGMNPDLSDLRLIHQMIADGATVDPEIIKRWNHLFGCDDETLSMQITRNQSLTKFMNYIEKQGGKPKEAKNDWKDYIEMVTEMNEVDTLDPYYRYPKNLRKAHDKAVADHRNWKKAEEVKKNRQIAKMTKEVLEKATGSGYEMKAAGLMIVIPKSAEEIKKEGELQHHCVGTYVERVARGETMILFVRKEKEPDKPYFTMEWKKDHVEQCRGKHNADMPKEVQAFVNAFEQRMKRRAV